MATDRSLAADHLVVTGATGLLGRAFAGRVDMLALTRDVASYRGPAVRWDPEHELAPRRALQGARAVVHLAGEPIADGRWTEKRKRRIRDSRIVGTRHLVAALATLERRPGVLVSASAVGYYGDRGDEVIDEATPAGDDFLARLCADWEAEARKAEALGVRVVCVRIGIVLARGGGALQRMLGPFRLGLGGRLGRGTQWMPWVHIDDVVGIVLHACATPTLHGPVNAVAPQAVTNAAFSKALGRALHRPALLPVPRTALRVLFGELSSALLASQRVLPRAATAAGYVFRQPDLAAALADVLETGVPA